MSGPDFDQRLARLRAELGDHAVIARELGIDFERPVRSLGDGYPENSVTLIGKIVERLLKQVSGRCAKSFLLLMMRFEGFGAGLGW